MSRQSASGRETRFPFYRARAQYKARKRRREVIHRESAKEQRLCWDNLMRSQPLGNGIMPVNGREKGGL